MQIEKGTHEPYRTELFMPVMKGKDSKYMAVLSDNSTDRDEERISRSCIEKMSQDDNYLAALCNHSNDVFMLVAEWTNKGCREVDGYTALIAEPKFYKSNARAREIQGMLDEGAKIGVSIGAIVKNYDEIDGQRVFTELELLEASFVAIPSNRHGRAMAVAKSFNKSKEVMKMTELTQKDIDSAVGKKEAELKVEFDKTIDEKDKKIADLTADLKKSEDAAAEAADAAKSDAEAAKAEAEEKEAALKAEVESAKKAALEKQKYADGTPNDKKLSSEDVDKAFDDGKLPVMRG
jgi:hypothetical protein